jgi:uncharacterized protein YndB with AHSA1/START domain
MEGTAQRTDDGYVLTFERDLGKPIDKVWASLTEAPKMSKWLGGEGSTLELRVGGRVHLADHGIESTVVDLDPPRVIEFGFKGKDWDGGTVRWELEPQGDRTRLVLTHRMIEIDPDQERRIVEEAGIDPDEYPTLPRTLAGWHTLLDGLERYIEGGDSLPDDHWKKVFELYRANV